MRLSDYTDDTLRVLMSCAQHREHLVTISELAEIHGLSKGYLMTVVNNLARQELIETTRGRGGGLRLAKEPGLVRIGDVVRALETDFRLVECFDASTNTCTLTPDCRLKHWFDAALRGYVEALDGVSLADLTSGPPGPDAPADVSPVRVNYVVAVTMPISTRPRSQAKAPEHSSESANDAAS